MGPAFTASLSTSSTVRYTSGWALTPDTKLLDVSSVVAPMSAMDSIAGRGVHVREILLPEFPVASGWLGLAIELCPAQIDSTNLP